MVEDVRRQQNGWRPWFNSCPPLSGEPLALSVHHLQSHRLAGFGDGVPAMPTAKDPAATERRRQALGSQLQGQVNLRWANSRGEWNFPSWAGCEGDYGWQRLPGQR